MLLHYGLYTQYLSGKKTMNSYYMPAYLTPLATVTCILQPHLYFYNEFGLKIVESGLAPLH